MFSRGEKPAGPSPQPPAPRLGGTLYANSSISGPETHPVSEHEMDPVSEHEMDPVSEHEMNPVSERETHPISEPEMPVLGRSVSGCEMHPSRSTR